VADFLSSCSLTGTWPVNPKALTERQRGTLCERCIL
jgi:hypothetical protein